MNISEINIPKMYSLQEVSEYLDIPMGTLYNMSWRGTLPCYRVGKRIKMTEEQIRMLISKQGCLYEKDEVNDR